MRRLALFTTLATGTLLIGCPNPGIGPGSSGGAGGVTASGGASSGGNTTSSMGGTTTTTTCSGADCQGEIFFFTFGDQHLDAGKTIRFDANGNVLWTGTATTTTLDQQELFFEVRSPTGEKLDSYSASGDGEQSPSGAVESQGKYILTGQGDPTGGGAQDGFVQYFNKMPLDPPTATAVISSLSPDRVSAVVPTTDNNASVFVAGLLGDTGTVEPSGTLGSNKLGNADDLFVMKVQDNATPTWVLPFAGTAPQSAVGGLDLNPVDHLLYLGVTLNGALDVPLGMPTTFKPVMNDPSDGLVILMNPTAGAAVKAISVGSDKADRINAILADPESNPPSFYVAGTIEGDAFGVNGMNLDSANSGQEQDGFVARLTSDGTKIWYQRFTGAGKQEIKALAWAKDSIFAVGNFNDNSTIGPQLITHGATGVDIALIRLNRADGVVQSVQTSSGAGDEYPADIGVSGSTATGDLGVWMTGDFKGAFSFLGKTESTKSAKADDFDGFLMRIPE